MPDTSQPVAMKVSKHCGVQTDTSPQVTLQVLGRKNHPGTGQYPERLNTETPEPVPPGPSLSSTFLALHDSRKIT